MTGGIFFYLVTLLSRTHVKVGSPLTWEPNIIRTPIGRTFPSHAHLETLLESAILTLVSVMLVYGTGSVSSARVGQVPSDGSLEEGLAALAGKLSIVFSTGLVSTDHTFYVWGCLVWTVRWTICSGYCCSGWGGCTWWCVFGYLSLRLWYCCHRLGCYRGWCWGRLLGCCLWCLRHRGRGRWRSWSRRSSHCSVQSTIVRRRAPFLQSIVGWSPWFLESVLGWGSPGSWLANRCVHHSHIYSQHYL